MSYRFHAQHPWIHPLTALQQLGDCQHLALLYSGSMQQNTGRYSYLAWQPHYVHAMARFADFPISDDTLEAGLPQWFGFVGYGMRHDAEAGLAKSEKPPIPMPDAVFMQYTHLLRFDHKAQIIDQFVHPSAQPAVLKPTPNAKNTAPKVTELFSNMTRGEYLQHVRATKDTIARGDFYQANITRKFYGSAETDIDARSLFTALCEASPAPYSALILMGSRAIISSSPEGFIAVDDSGTIRARPIKGSAPREADSAADMEILNALIASEKNHAENLMIVDLMRNDLARVCTPHSVQVSDLARAYSYSTIHHLISTIEGARKPDTGMAEIFRASFPPGSMTGAPKIAAMNWCAACEPHERGVYSGAIGWLGAQQTGEFSVVIRTIITSGSQFEFQVGGGIVADSDAEEEWRETLTKARGVAQALGIALTDLEAL